MGVTGFLLGFIVFQREKIIKKILIELFEDQHPPSPKKNPKIHLFFIQLKKTGSRLLLEEIIKNHSRFPNLKKKIWTADKKKRNWFRRPIHFTLNQ